MRKISLLIIIMIVLSVFVGCSKDVVEETDKKPIVVKIAGLKGPTSIGMIRLIDEKSLNSEDYTVEYITESAPDALTGKIINGDIQISSVPINLASVLYNKTEGAVQLMALNTIGNLFVVGTDDEITSLVDLDGKNFGMSAKGSTPDFAMNYILKQNKLEDKVELDYDLDHATLAQRVIAGDAKVALLPQPFVTQVMMQNKNVKILFDLNEVWESATMGESELLTGGIIVNREFAENNKEFVAEFLKLYKDSVNWVNKNPKDASILVEENEIMPNAALVEKAIPNSGITYKSATEEISSINSFYKILFDSNSASIGGSLPDEDFYYSE